MIPGRFVQSFLQQATEQESRSTVLKPLGWMMALLVGGMITAFYLTSPPWVGILLGIFAGITMGLYLFAYVYCMFTDKDALRSETYSIQNSHLRRAL